MLIVSVGYGYLRKEHVIKHTVVYFPHQNNDDETTIDRNDEHFMYGMGAKQKTAKPVFFKFDPNDLPERDWKKMGFSDKQIAVIKNYEAKGGKFYKKEDVAKMYSISKQEYEQIEPYIVIEKKDRNTSIVPNHIVGEIVDRKISTLETIDINVADTSALKTLKGIGSILANRVIRYRDALGGFHAVSQIGEVYGISPEVFEDIQSHLVIGDRSIKKLNLNTSTKEQLSKHPYVSYKQASLIVNYRTQHGLFANLEDLQNISVLDLDFFRKIEPYIEL